MSADYNVPHTVVVNPNVQQVKAAVVVSRSPIQPSNINVSIEGSGPVSQSTPAKSFFSPRVADQTTQDSELLNAMEGEENDVGAINTIMVRLDLDSKFGFKSGMNLMEGMRSDEATPGPVVVDSVDDRSPAARAGICKGDTILAMNGENVMHLGLAAVLQKLFKAMSEDGIVRLCCSRTFLRPTSDRSHVCSAGSLVADSAIVFTAALCIV